MPPLKKKLHHWNIDFYLNNENKVKPSEIDIINAVTDIWYNDNSITQDIIIKSFKSTGISSNLDGSEDNLIIHHEEICDEIVSPYNLISDEKELNQIIENVENERKKNYENKQDLSQPKITNFFTKNNNDKMDLD